MLILELIGAYGRTYATRNDASRDWVQGKDFKIKGGGPYCSVRDIEVMRRMHEHAIIVIAQGEPLSLW